jgi:hypothetical protein
MGKNNYKLTEYIFWFLNDKVVNCIAILLLLVLLSLMLFLSLSINTVWLVTIFVGVFLSFPFCQYVRKSIVNNQKQELRKEPSGFLKFWKYFHIAEILYLVLLLILSPNI